MIVKLLGPNDADILSKVARDVFDKPIDADLTAEFLKERRHHLAVAIDGDIVVGRVSAVDYVHPDKPRELCISEVAVAATHRRAALPGKCST